VSAPGAPAARVTRAGLVALPLLGILEFGAYLGSTLRAPREGDWDQVTGLVREMKGEGCLVVIAPPWADPAARRAFGDELMPLRDVARPDVSRYACALEVSILGERSEELGGFRETVRREAGAFTLRKLESPRPARVVYDFVDHVRPPDADVRGTDPPLTCAWNAAATVVAGGLGGHPTFPRERFECPGGVFFNVGVTVIADEAFQPRRCIWSHPFARGEIVTRFHDVPLGQVIRGHGGMYWIIERERRGAPITLTVRVDGEVVGSVVHRDGDGFAPFELPLSSRAGTRAETVEFAVSSPNYRERHFCFEADTR
jgi:hypothetical protein